MARASCRTGHYPASCIANDVDVSMFTSRAKMCGHATHHDMSACLFSGITGSPSTGRVNIITLASQGSARVAADRRQPQHCHCVAVIKSRSNNPTTLIPHGLIPHMLKSHSLTPHSRTTLQSDTSQPAKRQSNTAQCGISRFMLNFQALRIVRDA